MSQATVSGTADNPLVTAPIDANALRGLSARLGMPLPVGNEGAGTVNRGWFIRGGPRPARKDGGGRRRIDVRPVSNVDVTL